MVLQTTEIPQHGKFNFVQGWDSVVELGSTKYHLCQAVSLKRMFFDKEREKLKQQTARVMYEY